MPVRMPEGKISSSLLSNSGGWGPLPPLGTPGGVLACHHRLALGLALFRAMLEEQVNQPGRLTLCIDYEPHFVLVQIQGQYGVRRAAHNRPPPRLPAASTQNMNSGGGKTNSRWLIGERCRTSIATYPRETTPLFISRYRIRLVSDILSAQTIPPIQSNGIGPKSNRLMAAGNCIRASWYTRIPKIVP